MSNIEKKEKNLNQLIDKLNSLSFLIIINIFYFRDFEFFRIKVISNKIWFSRKIYASCQDER